MVEDLVDNLMEVVMMIIRIRMRLEVVAKTRWETILIISMIWIIEIGEEEAENKDLEEEDPMGNVFIVDKNGIENLNVPNTKEGKIKE